jgi:hypothetical protein
MERFGTMTAEEYNVAFSDYPNLTHPQKVILIRRVVLEISDFMQARKGLEDMASIRRYVQLLPSIQQRHVQMDTYLNQLKTFVAEQ